jgi:peptidoglycan/xylan/chitin deacetylase (PgdA/CDA1 family)
MIGIIASPAEQEVVREFFELFKTAWEFRRPGAPYDVLICSNVPAPERNSAKLTIVYGNKASSIGSEQDVSAISRPNRVLRHKRDRIPLYGECLGFKVAGDDEFLIDELTREPVAFEVNASGQRFIRVGFDLFGEIKHLLTVGQPALHAHIPTVDLHIALLRELILRSSCPLLEIPPVPSGFEFIACLTHDVDHAAVRAHKWDHTIAGFLYRAVVGSVVDFFRGRKTARDVAVNWLAAVSLPFVYLGLARDFWNRLERYAEIEGGLPSTFFVIPRAGDPGRVQDGSAPARRATRYNLFDIADQLRRLRSSRHEVGLHGIDAWRDVESARTEKAAVEDATTGNSQESVAGVRMHWLYFNEFSPGILDATGFAYDSSIGFNDTAGYRTGMCQAYRPLGVTDLMELPLHVMDTALLFPAHMNLSQSQAKEKIDALIANAKRFGGVLTINWHDRSIAPERLWHRLYSELLVELKRSGAWFATGSEAVAWFNKRRAFTFEQTKSSAATLSMDQSSDPLPGLTITEHGSSEPAATAVARCSFNVGGFLLNSALDVGR